MTFRMTFPTALDGLYIDGQWSAGNEHLRVINPATEALLTTVNGGDEHAVDQAVTAATNAFKEWSKNHRRRARGDPAQNRRRRAGRS